MLRALPPPRLAAILEHKRGKLDGWVYAFQGSEGPLKIGHSHRPRSRRNAVQSSYPFSQLQIVALFPGSTASERGIHRELAGARLSGEWFKPTAYVKSILRAHTRRASLEVTCGA